MGGGIDVGAGVKKDFRNGTVSVFGAVKKRLASTLRVGPMLLCQVVLTHLVRFRASFSRAWDDLSAYRFFGGASGGPRSFRPLSIRYLYARRLLPAHLSPGRSSAALRYAASAPARSPVRVSASPR